MKKDLEHSKGEYVYDYSLDYLLGELTDSGRSWIEEGSIQNGKRRRIFENNDFQIFSIKDGLLHGQCLTVQRNPYHVSLQEFQNGKMLSTYAFGQRP